MKYFARFFSDLQQDLKAFIFWCLIFSFFRAIFIAIYHTQLSDAASGEILVAMLLGLRLSLKTCGIIMLVGVAAATMPHTVSKKWPSDKIRLCWHSIALMFFTVCFFVRIPYYDIFNSGFNMMLINGMHDDIYAILITAIEEYQLLYRLPVALLTGGILIWLLKNFLQHTGIIDLTQQRYGKVWAAIIITLLPVFWIFIRYGGAFSYSMSVNWESAARTKSNLLNEAILDDGQALYRVYITKVMLEKVTDVNISLPDLKHKITLLGGNPESDSLSKAFERTVVQPKLNYQPHNIVLIIGESFGLWPFLPQFENLNLVGESFKLQQSSNGASVKHMLPNGSGTIVAINGIVTGLPDTGLYENYQPNSMRDKYQSGIGYIMHQLGYKTVFWYGGFSGWQNIKNFVLAQSFDEFHCADEFDYRGGDAWGCSDKDLFSYISQHIAAQPESEKVLHVVMTTSNHPPYTVDVVREGFAKEQVRAKLSEDIDNDNDTLTELGHIWYTDQVIGQFAENLKKLNPGSLLIVTGDHSERFGFAKEQQIKTLSAVPCIFYAPGVQQEWFKNTAGCHIQIAGTMAELIAPVGFKYMAFLPNMFTEQTVFNHRLYADKDDIELLAKNEEVRNTADCARSIAAWRILKGDKY